MESDPKQLIELVAELCERLRLFAGRLPRGPAVRREPGALATGERLALSSRVLAQGLSTRGGREAADLAEALGTLADAVESVPTPLAGSGGAASLAELVQVMDDLAGAWDRQGQVEMPLLWARVRAAGDLVWPATRDAESTRPSAVDEQEPQARSAPEPAGEVWLLISGEFRRGTLAQRLLAAGFSVVRFDSADAVLSRLQDHSPQAVICDDAAPGRHHRRLSGNLPDASLPLVMVRAGQGGTVPTCPAWLPPYRIDDLLELLR